MVPTICNLCNADFVSTGAESFIYDQSSTTVATNPKRILCKLQISNNSQMGQKNTKHRHFSLSGTD